MLASDATRHTHHRHYAIDKDTEGSTHTQATVSTRQYEMAWSATRGPGSREECTTTHVRDREQVGRRHQELGLALLLCCHGTAACHDTEEPHLALSLTVYLPACLLVCTWLVDQSGERRTGSSSLVLESACASEEGSKRITANELWGSRMNAAPTAQKKHTIDRSVPVPHYF